MTQSAQSPAEDPIRQRVIDLITEQLGFSADKAQQINDDSEFGNDLGADSLDTVEIVMTFEDEFEIQVSDEEAEQLVTVGKAIAYLKAAIIRKEAAEKEAPKEAA